MDPAVGTALLTKEKLIGKTEIHLIPIFSDNIYFMFSKKSVQPDIIDVVNKSLRKLKENGNYQKIVI